MLCPETKKTKPYPMRLVAKKNQFELWYCDDCDRFYRYEVKTHETKEVNYHKKV